MSQTVTWLYCSKPPAAWRILLPLALCRPCLPPADASVGTAGQGTQPLRSICLESTGALPDPHGDLKMPRPAKGKEEGKKSSLCLSALNHQSCSQQRVDLNPSAEPPFRALGSRAWARERGRQPCPSWATARTLPANRDTAASATGSSKPASSKRKHSGVCLKPSYLAGPRALLHATAQAVGYRFSPVPPLSQK